MKDGFIRVAAATPKIKVADPEYNAQQIIELILNTAYFIPLGCLYGLRAKPVEAALIALITIIGIETIQYVFYIGTFDIWDIITNFTTATDT